MAAPGRAEEIRLRSLCTFTDLLDSVNNRALNHAVAGLHIS